VAPVLSPRWATDGRCGIGSLATWREFSLPFVSEMDTAKSDYGLITSSYDPEFGDWELGKLSALREIALAIESDYQYYYMGMCQRFVRPLWMLI
jgi:hypothetical protein